MRMRTGIGIKIRSAITSNEILVTTDTELDLTDTINHSAIASIQIPKTILSKITLKKFENCEISKGHLQKYISVKQDYFRGDVS